MKIYIPPKKNSKSDVLMIYYQTQYGPNMQVDTIDRLSQIKGHISIRNTYILYSKKWSLIQMWYPAIKNKFNNWSK